MKSFYLFYSAIVLILLLLLLLLLLYSNLFDFLKHQYECNLDWDSTSQISQKLSPI